MKTRERPKALGEYAKPDSKPVTRSVSLQELAELKRIREDGLAVLSNGMYSNTYRLQDVNYQPEYTAERESVMQMLVDLYNVIGSPFKLSITNRNCDYGELMDSYGYGSSMEEPGFYEEKFNELILSSARQSRGGRVQDKFLTVPAAAVDEAAAERQYITMEANVRRELRRLGSDLKKTDRTERLRVLHSLFNSGREAEFKSMPETWERRRSDWKNDIVPKKAVETETELVFDTGQGKQLYVRVFYIRRYPASVDDELITELSNHPVRSLISIDVVPVPPEASKRDIVLKSDRVEASIRKQTRIRNDRREYHTDISKPVRDAKEEIEARMDAYDRHDQKLFFVGVTMAVYADSMEELDRFTDYIYATGKKYETAIEILENQQMEGFLTALPAGPRHTYTMRSMLTRELAVLVPFYVQELQEPDGIYWGRNEVSKKSIFGNRRLLANGGGWIFGKSGYGKTMFCFCDLFQNMMRYPEDDFIIIDPKDDYKERIRAAGGAVADFADLDLCINPLHADSPRMGARERREFLREKAELMLALAQQRTSQALGPKEESIVVRVVSKLYEGYFSGKRKEPPDLGDFHYLLTNQPEPEAAELATCFEMMTNGAVSCFTGQSNVRFDNRVTCFSLLGLGENLRPFAMTIILDFITGRVNRNFKEGRVTDIRIDESHEIWGMPLTSAFFAKKWKTIRSLGGILTAILQNAAKVEQDPAIAESFSNSSFFCSLHQSETDAEALQRLLAISPAFIRYVTAAMPGHGLISHGSVLIPFDFELPKDSALYRRFNTNFHELHQGERDE